MISTKNKIYLVNGLPASGKTSIVNTLAEHLSLPLYAKDDFKELLGEIYPPTSVEDSQKLGAATFDLLYFLARVQLRSNNDCIVEASFSANFAKPQLERMVEEYNAAIIEIYCWCDDEVRKQRYIARESSGSRHKVHLDGQRQISDEVSVPEPLSLNEHVFTLNTTNGYDTGLVELLHWLKQFESVPNEPKP